MDLSFQQMSRNLGLDLKDFIILVHTATRLTVRIVLDRAAGPLRLQDSNGKWARLADAKRPITHVVLLGESALKATFLGIVTKYVEEWPIRTPAISSKNDSFG